jgi:DNA-binding Lrp family transcriptional regulator
MISGLVFANCYLDQDTLAEKTIRQINGVLEVHRTYGVYDLVVKIQAADEEKLNRILRDIRSTQGVQSVLTSIVYRQEAGLGAAIA